LRRNITKFLINPVYLKMLFCFM